MVGEFGSISMRCALLDLARSGNSLFLSLYMHIYNLFLHKRTFIYWFPGQTSSYSNSYYNHYPVMVIYLVHDCCFESNSVIFMFVIFLIVTIYRSYFYHCCCYCFVLLILF